MPSNKEAVIQAVESGSEIGVAGLSQRLCLDKGTVRKVALEATREGRIGARNDGQGYVFFPATNQAGQRFLRGAEPSNSGQSEPPVIDVHFREIPPPPSSTGRALVPVGQPFDSRTEAALRQHARAKALAARASQGHRIGGQFVSSLDQLFAVDPTGDFTLAAMELAEVEAARRQLAREQQEADARAAAERPRELSGGELAAMAAMVAMKGLLAWNSLAEQQAEARAATRQSEPTPQHGGFVEDRFARRQREAKEQVEEAARPRTDFVEQLLAKKKTVPSAQAEEPSWWRRHLGTPAKSVWR